MMGILPGTFPRHRFGHPAAPAPPCLPVMVWIHGGGFATGGGNKASFNGIYLPALTKDLIVVTLNYRLNIFGFLGAREITDPGYGTGNWGILDQRAAMQWVHTHISGVSSHRRS